MSGTKDKVNIFYKQFIARTCQHER